MEAAAPTVLLDAREPSLPAIELEEDLFVVEPAAAHPAPHASAHADLAPPPFDDIADEEPPFDAPDPDDEVFQARRQTLVLEAGDIADAEIAAAATTPPVRVTPRAPAIRIHVSWERDDAKAMLAAFAGDPRLARAEITQMRGGIDAAHARFSKLPSPDLLILDTSLGSRSLLAALDPLLLRLEQRTRLIVIGEANDVNLVRDLARRGVAYYLLAPKPDDVIARICDLYATHDGARTIAVVGARGGAGASTLARNLAWSIAERQYARTALVDLDLSFGASPFGGESTETQSMGVGFLAPDLVDDAFLDRACMKQSERLDLYAVPPGVVQPFDLEAESVKRVIAQVRRTAEYVVLDVPHHWAPWVKQVLADADEVIIVAPPDLASLRNAKNLLEALKASRQNTSEPLYILSMTGAAKGTEISARDFTEAMNAKPVDVLEFDPALFGMSAMSGETIGVMAPRSKAAMTIDALAWVLTGLAPGARQPARDVLPRAPADQPPPPLAASAPDPTALPVSPKPRVRARGGHARSHAAALAVRRRPRRGSGAIRALLTVAMVAAVCVMSVQNHDLAHAFGQASGVLH